MGIGPWPGGSQGPACHSSAPLGSELLSPWAPPSLKEQNPVRSESPGMAGTTSSPGCQDCGVWRVGRPCTLTVPQEDNEVLGPCLDGLQLLGGIQGLGCLVVPEGWVFLLSWPRGEGGQVSLGEAPCVWGLLGGAPLPGMTPRETCSLRPTSSSRTQAPCMPVGWQEGGRAGTPEGLGPWRWWNLD